MDFERLPHPEQVVDPSGDPRTFDIAALEAAFATLRPEEREAIYLCVVEGYTATEAGELAGRPKNTVLSLVHRGRARIRAWFAAQTDEEALP